MMKETKTELIINKMPQAKYDELFAAGQIDDNQIYYITDDNDKFYLKSETYTQSEINNLIDTKVAAIVESAPETLNTLNELAAALGDNPNFATDISNEIGTKASTTYVNDELSKKQNTLVVGSNISIDQDTNTISAVDTVYTLPTADDTTLGGVKAGPSTPDDTQEVHINSDGKLVTKAGGSDNTKKDNSNVNALNSKMDMLVNNNYTMLTNLNSYNNPAAFGLGDLNDEQILNSRYAHINVENFLEKNFFVDGEKDTIGRISSIDSRIQLYSDNLIRGDLIPAYRYTGVDEDGNKYYEPGLYEIRITRLPDGGYWVVTGQMGGNTLFVEFNLSAIAEYKETAGTDNSLIFGAYMKDFNGGYESRPGVNFNISYADDSGESRPGVELHNGLTRGDIIYSSTPIKIFESYFILRGNNINCVIYPFVLPARKYLSQDYKYNISLTQAYDIDYVVSAPINFFNPYDYFLDDCYLVKNGYVEMDKGSDIPIYKKAFSTSIALNSILPNVDSYIDVEPSAGAIFYCYTDGDFHSFQTHPKRIANLPYIFFDAKTNKELYEESYTDIDGFNFYKVLLPPTTKKIKILPREVTQSEISNNNTVYTSAMLLTYKDPFRLRGKLSDEMSRVYKPVYKMHIDTSRYNLDKYDGEKQLFKYLTYNMIYQKTGKTPAITFVSGMPVENSEVYPPRLPYLIDGNIAVLDFPSGIQYEQDPLYPEAYICTIPLSDILPNDTLAIYNDNDAISSLFFCDLFPVLYGTQNGELCIWWDFNNQLFKVRIPKFETMGPYQSDTYQDIDTYFDRAFGWRRDGQSNRPRIYAIRGTGNEKMGIDGVYIDPEDKSYNIPYAMQLYQDGTVFAVSKQGTTMPIYLLFSSLTKKDLGGTSLTPEQIQNIDSIPNKADTSYVDNKVAGIVNSAPKTLDTLNELATALGNDANFLTTVTTEIGKKQNKLIYAQSLPGDTSGITEGTIYIIPVTK